MAQIPLSLPEPGTHKRFHRWPQLVDDLLEDMGVPAMRSGGNWLTWPFKVIDLNEISTLKAERDAKRSGGTS